jgi:hypothetical protein
VKKILVSTSAVLLWAGLCLGATADTIHQTGAYSAGGQTVNAYTNGGAQEYYRTMRSSGGGTIYNVQPPPSLRPKRTFSPAELKIPSTVSYSSSVRQDLAERWVQVGDERVDIAAIAEREGKRYNVDPLLIEEVIRQESAFQPTALSGVGAQGLMQLMPGTAAMMGVRDLSDPEENIAGGTRYLAEQLSTFGRLDLALAAYNAGPGSVQQFGGVPPYAETQGYVSRIVACYNNRVQQERAKKGKNGSP